MAEVIDLKKAWMERMDRQVEEEFIQRISARILRNIGPIIAETKILDDRSKAMSIIAGIDKSLIRARETIDCDSN